TMTWLDGWFQDRGGRRGRAQTRAATGGLTYAGTRHATSRAGGPAPHDPVLGADVGRMLRPTGGPQAPGNADVAETGQGRCHGRPSPRRLGGRQPGLRRDG